MLAKSYQSLTLLSYIFQAAALSIYEQPMPVFARAVSVCDTPLRFMPSD